MPTPRMDRLIYVVPIADEFALKLLYYNNLYNYLSMRIYLSQVIDFACDSGYEPEGRVFESLRAHHKNTIV
jgi:hypothetical protein